jgi:hypothetical protein
MLSSYVFSFDGRRTGRACGELVKHGHILPQQSKRQRGVHSFVQRHASDQTAGSASTPPLRQRLRPRALQFQQSSEMQRREIPNVPKDFLASVWLCQVDSSIKALDTKALDTWHSTFHSRRTLPNHPTLRTLQGNAAPEMEVFMWLRQACGVKILHMSPCSFFLRLHSEFKCLSAARKSFYRKVWRADCAVLTLEYSQERTVKGCFQSKTCTRSSAGVVPQ